MRHTTVEYNRKQKAWNLWSVWYQELLGRAFPDTGGCELFVHNWYSCSKDERLRKAADAMRQYGWNRWRRIDDRYERLYNRADHLEHIREGRNGFYLWCDECKTV